MKCIFLILYIITFSYANILPPSHNINESLGGNVDKLFNKLIQENGSIIYHEDEIIESYSNNTNSSALNNLMGVLYVKKNDHIKAISFLRFLFYYIYY